ncbi:hypothetical protein LTS18_010015 [Coniosporium uncinatum]|uniref:Uncharacterized protein n=1 Tax=Coniosporium uncinatum TaxID=93489 RepID=A0ACC3DWP7_9PEZI|nr:hypothetical protein LTS18_010015 [Coniosporium uncinatum]
MAETEYSEGEEGALARKPVGQPIAGVTLSQEELAEVLKMVDEEAAREAEQQHQSQISTDSEPEEVRPPEKGKRKAPAEAEQPPEVVADGVVTRGKKGVRKPRKASLEASGRAPPKPRGKQAAKAPKTPQKEASPPPAATNSRVAVSKPAQKGRKKQSRAATPPPTQSPPPGTPAVSSLVNLLSPDSQKTVKLPERPSPHTAKKQRTAPEPKAPPKYVLKSKTFYHNEKVDSWDELFAVDELLFTRFTQKADAVARLAVEEAGNLYAVFSRVAVIHGSGGPGSHLHFDDIKVTDHVSWATLLGKVQSMYIAEKKIVRVDIETRAASRVDWQLEEPAAQVSVPASTQAKNVSGRAYILTQSSQPSARAATERIETLNRIQTRIIEAFACEGKLCKEGSYACLRDELNSKIHYRITTDDIAKLALRVDANIGTLNEIDVENPPQDWLNQVRKNQAVRKEALKKRGKRRERERSPQAESPHTRTPAPAPYTPYYGLTQAPPAYHTPYAPPYYHPPVMQQQTWPRGPPGVPEPQRKSSPVGSQSDVYTVYDYCDWFAKRYKKHALLFSEAARVLADEGWILTTIAIKSEADVKEVVHKSGIASLLKAKIKLFLDEIKSQSSSGSA